MADVKISNLPASTTPLAGAEVLPIVQSGTTVKVSVANLTAGRAIGATDATLTGALSVTPTWNAGGTTFTGIGLNVTDTASAAGSLLLDLQVSGTSQFHVTKGGANHLKRSNYNIASANTAIITASNYSLTGSSADSMLNLSGTWNTSGTPTAIKTNITDTASAAGSLLLDLQVGGSSQFKVSKGGKVTAQTLTIGLGGQTSVATNTALGFEALNSASLTGTNNVGVGYGALLSNTSGSNNSAVGFAALILNTTGGANSATGAYALYSNTTGSQNSAVGISALQNNTTGANNSAVGYAALLNYNTSNNTAVGVEAAKGSSTVANNTGNNLTAVGYQALLSNTSGSNNIAIGYQAGDAITTGSTNLVIGHIIDVDSATGSNQINIGDRYFHDRIRLLERTSDPAKPAEGNMIVWLSDGTGLGDDGDVIISSTAGGVTNYAILFDHSAGTLWP